MQSKQDHTQSLEKPLVSFILTYYNQPVDMLCECIDSILNLSIRDFEREIIVVDDGSQTSPMNDLLKYGDDIIYLRKGNGGVSTARNMGMAMASGKFIQLVDSDDRLLQAPYEHCLDIARFNNADMVMYDFTNQPKADLNYEDQGPTTGSELMRNQNIHGTACCYLFSQAIRGDLQFTPGIHYCEDEEFTAQLLLRAESLHTTTAKAYYYRENADSATHQTSLRSTIRRLSDARTVISRLNALTDHLPNNDRIALQRRIAQLTMDYLYNIIRLTNSRHYLARKIEGLRREGLFPLPDYNYTTKYTWFRRMTNSPKGLSLLMRLIPLIQKER